MDVLGSERLAQGLLQVNNLFVCLFVNFNPRSSISHKFLMFTLNIGYTKDGNMQAKLF